MENSYINRGEYILKKLGMKLLAGIVVAGFSVSMLVGCGAPKPADTVNDL